MAANYYPLDEEEGSDTERLSITFTREQKADLELIADTWNAIDRALELKRKKWTLQRVVSRLLDVGIDGVWQQLGGRPATKAEREQFIRDVVERVKSKQKK